MEKYVPTLTAPPDMDSYWDGTLREYADKPLNASREKTDTPMPYIEVFKVVYEGVDDTPVHGWYLLPRFTGPGKLPCIVLFHGYGGSKGFPEDYAKWLLAGIAVFSIDVRGQTGETGNRHRRSFGTARGWMTEGILDRDTCYYKAITIDALKALDWVSEQPEVDPGRICVAGESQGGGLAMIAAALSRKPAAAVADIPNMCHMDYGILHSDSSLSEAASLVSRFPEYLSDVLTTLSYFDNMNLAHRIRIPILVSCGLKDTCCMPETVYAAFNRITADKQMHTYPFNGHHVSGYHHRLTIQFVRERLGLGC